MDQPQPVLKQRHSTRMRQWLKLHAVATGLASVVPQQRPPLERPRCARLQKPQRVVQHHVLHPQPEKVHHQPVFGRDRRLGQVDAQRRGHTALPDFVGAQLLHGV